MAATWNVGLGKYVATATVTQGGDHKEAYVSVTDDAGNASPIVTGRDISADGQSLVLTFSKAMAASAIVDGDFSISGANHITGYSWTDSTHLSLTLLNAVTRDQTVDLRYLGTGFSDAAGTALPGESTAHSVHNGATASGSFAPAITGIAFVEHDANGNHYLDLSGSGFAKVLDSANGEVAGLTDISAHLDFSKISWDTGSQTYNLLGGVDHAVLDAGNSNTDMRIYLSNSEWSTLTGDSHFLTGSDGVTDSVSIGNGFLHTPGGTIASGDGAAAGTDANPFATYAWTPSDSGSPTTYADTVQLSAAGGGDFYATNVHGSGVALDVQNALGSSDTLNLHGLDGSVSFIENRNTQGTVAIFADQSLSNDLIVSDSTGRTEVWMDGGTAGSNTSNGVSLQGSGINVYFDEHASSVSLDSVNAQVLHFIGLGAAAGSFSADGFATGVDKISLDTLSVTLAGDNATLAGSDFEAQAAGAFNAGEHIHYDTSTGGVYYDASATNTVEGAMVLLMTLSNYVTLAATDFKILP